MKGFPTQTASFHRLTDARKWARQTEVSLREGRHFKSTEAKRHTLAEAIDRYVTKILPTKPKSGFSQTGQLQWWKEILGTYTLAEITPALLAEQCDKLLEEKTKRKELRTPATVNRYLSALSHVFTVAIKEWQWIEENPLLKITKPKEPRGRTPSSKEHHCKTSKADHNFLSVIQDMPKFSLIDTPNLNSEKNKTPAADISLPLYTFEVKDTGIFYCKYGQIPIWLCAKLEISALTRDPNNENWGRVLEVKDADQQSH